MFTGIIEATAPVLKRTDVQLTVGRPASFTDVRLGSSICVAGVCLSVISFDDTSMAFDVVPETWERTTLGDRSPGDLVNLERAVCVDGRFEGHIVQGHVEGVGEVLNSLSPHLLPKKGAEGLELTSIPKPLPPVEEGTSENETKKQIHPSPPLEEGVGVEVEQTIQEQGRMMVIRLPSNLVQFVIPKGSIAVDGAALTVAAIEGNRCTVALIPYSLANTTLGALREGDRVNIETDIFVRAVAALIPASAHGR